MGLELDLEHYVIPAPSTSANSAFVYAANMTETPRSLKSGWSSSNSFSIRDGGVTIELPATVKV